MKIKAAQIAKDLGLSKATVSLALNNKPGVSRETKIRIIDYLDKMEHEINVNNENRIIRVVIYDKKMEISEYIRMDLWSGVASEFSREAKKDGFSVVVDYVDIQNQKEMKEVIQECQDSKVCGIIIMGYDMKESDFDIFSTIHKPIIIYDNDVYDQSSCIMVDNQDGVLKAIRHYMDLNQCNITYLANDSYNFNFIKRREAFLYFRNKYSIDGDIVFCGEDIDAISENIKVLYQNNKIGQNILCENYQVSIGCIKALKELNVDIGKEVRIIGIDEVPDYSCFGYKLSCIKISHSQRAFLAIDLLKREILYGQQDHFKIFSKCSFIEGETA